MIPNISKLAAKLQTDYITLLSVVEWIENFEKDGPGRVHPVILAEVQHALKKVDRDQ